MRHLKRRLCLVMILSMVLFSCTEDISNGLMATKQQLNLTGQLIQENVTRANDFGFVTGDRMGIYVVDRINGEVGTLGASDNRAQNVLYTFDGDSYRWSSSTTIYWRDQQTPVDIYGYYPGVNYIGDPLSYQFEVRANQGTEAHDGELTGYEQSDLLWGKVSNQSYTTNQINVQFHHILAGVRVQLNKGNGISDVEWSKLEKIVMIENTITKSAVDLSTGFVTCGNSSVVPIRMLPQSDDAYRAVVIPQTVVAGKQLLSITLDGQSYSHKLETAMNYQAGCLHNFTLTVNKSEAIGDYEISVTDNGIIPWMNDESSHQFSAQAYVTVYCSEMGKLKESITAAGYDYKTIKNLKVTGDITHEDFDLMRDQMPELQHLNLKESKVKHICYYDGWGDHGSHDYDLYRDDMMPNNAFYGNNSIRSLILPSSIKRLGSNCFREMRLMYSTLEIPEGVTYIGDGALSYNEYNGVELILPNSLDSICDAAFHNCGYKCELKLSDNISYIGNAFYTNTGELGCENFYGVFHLPSKIKTLVPGMFNGLGRTGKFTGTIELPQGLTETPDYNYWGSWAPNLSNRIELILPSSMKRIGDLSLGGVLTKLQLNEGLEEIGYGNFSNGSAPFPLHLPSTLRSIERDCFSGSGFEGALVIPERCLYIAEKCFRDNEFTSIQLPSRLENIYNECFSDNHRLTQVTLPRYVSYIGEGAFNGCDALQTVICLNPEPPELGGAIFQGVFFDKCVLQVPEASVETYRHTAGWSQFKNITAYHELAFNIPEILALDKGQTTTGILRNEGAWHVSECPDWVTVSPSSGTSTERKEELTIKVKSMTTDGERTGRIVFSLDGKNYTTYTDVRQVSVNGTKEDQKIVLQTASAGASRAIPIFIVGEGYDADDIVSGKYLEDMEQQMEYLFSCEPYKSYRNYFTVSTAIAVSPESGINGRTRFTSDDWHVTRDDLVWAYAKAYGEGITEARAGETTIIVLQNTNNLGGNTSVLSDNGRTISYIGKSTDRYPYTQREYVLREVGGVAFGHLGVESVNHFTFLKSCTCPGCSGLSNYKHAKNMGWYDNISLSGKMNEVPWRDLIFHPVYAQYVDIYEGGYNHSRGVYRSENMSIMGDSFLPYFNTISRLSIVRRILRYAGETFSFDNFVTNDKIEIPE